MSENLFNLLHEPLLSISTTKEARKVSLPEVLALLCRDEVEAFEALQAHQEHAWYAFLVQLAVLALQGEEEVPTEASQWEALLLQLTAQQAEPWCLFVSDLSEPALLQPPVPEKKLDVFKNRIEHPDTLDILITSKNHDVKRTRIRSANPEHWLYALVTLQTMQGFLGAGNYGVARMNGGFASRPIVSYTPSLRLGLRWRRDVSVFQAAREELVNNFGYQAQGGAALLWLLPWDGTSSLPLSQCDPYFIEVCRRVRLLQEKGSLVAMASTSKAARVSAKELKGNVGDPWIPIAKDDSSALTVSKNGFNYRLITALLGGDYTVGEALQIHPKTDGKTPFFFAWAMVRGQGKTEGLQRRILPLPASVSRRLGKAEELLLLAIRAKGRIDIVDKIERKILYPALKILYDKHTNRWSGPLDDAIDQLFFPTLWEDLDKDPTEAENSWRLQVRDLAFAQLQKAIDDLPKSLRFYKLVSDAEGMFQGCFYQQFPDLKGSTSPAVAASASSTQKETTNDQRNS
jgi:CRISPR system Cascade subunit CasA